MTDIRQLDDLQQLVRDGETDWKQYGEVMAVYHDGMVLFNYTAAAQYEGRWNYFERISRGLILDAHNGDVIARPFDKFFNWLENGRKSIAPLLEVTEKLDGSLGILYRFGDEYYLATRGSFQSEQAIWATEYLREHYPYLTVPENVTLLFEVIYPDNRIVVDYGEREELVLIAARNMYSGEYWRFEVVAKWGAENGFSLPRVYDAISADDFIEAAKDISAHEEGWVLLFADGQRFKIKGDQYKLAHRMMTAASFKSVLRAMASGEFSSMIAGVPDEFLGEIRAYETAITERVERVTHEVEEAFKEHPNGTRKDFALWAQSSYPQLTSYLFSKLDGRDYLPLIYRREFRHD